MGRFFSRFKSAQADAAVSSWGNLATFYSLMIFLIVIPFVLIVALVWLTGVLGFSTWILAAFAGLLAYGGWRLYRGWGRFKSKLAAQGSEFQDLVREAGKNGKDVEISLLNGVVTLRYRGAGGIPALPAAAAPLALEGPDSREAQSWLPPERMREELEEFVRLRDTGVISPEEFDRIKTSLLQRISA